MEFLKSENEIRKWLSDYNISSYKIIKTKISKYPYVVHALDNVEISGNNLSFIPIKFNKIDGNLDCSKNKLTDLRFCPRKIGGSAYFNDNNISSLKGCPQTIGEWLDLSKNKLTITSLDDFPLNINISALINLKENLDLQDFQNATTSDIKQLIENIKKKKESIKRKNKLEKELKKPNGKIKKKIKI